MREILYRYKKYEIEYIRGLGIIIINKPIPVNKFIELKDLLKRAECEINDIRVYGEKYSRLKVM